MRFTDVKSTDLRAVQRDGYQLIIQYGVSDELTINTQFGADRTIQFIQFSDGVIWNTTDIETHAAALPILGTSGNDMLYGTSLADILVGGLGNDTYVVDNIGDQVSEALNEGTDTILSLIHI